LRYSPCIAAAETLSNEVLCNRLSDTHFNDLVEANLPLSGLAWSAIMESDFSIKRLSDEQFSLLTHDLHPNLLGSEAIAARLSDENFNKLAEACIKDDFLPALFSSRAACLRLTQAQFDAAILEAIKIEFSTENDFLFLGYAPERFSTEQNEKFNTLFERVTGNPNLQKTSTETEHALTKARRASNAQDADNTPGSWGALSAEHLCAALTKDEFSAALDDIANTDTNSVANLFYCQHVIERMTDTQFDRFVNLSMMTSDDALVSPFSIKRLSNEQFNRLITAASPHILLELEYVCERLNEFQFNTAVAQRPCIMLEFSHACRRASDMQFKLALRLYPRAGIDYPHVCERLSDEQFEVMINEYAEALSCPTVTKRMSDSLTVNLTAPFLKNLYPQFIMRTPGRVYRTNNSNVSVKNWARCGLTCRGCRRD
jgi:hypothetical protein